MKIGDRVEFFRLANRSMPEGIRICYFPPLNHRGVITKVIRPHPYDYVLDNWFIAEESLDFEGDDKEVGFLHYELKYQRCKSTEEQY